MNFLSSQVFWMQVLCIAGILIALVAVLRCVLKTTIADKYGVFWLAALSGLFCAVAGANVFALVSPETGWLSLAGILVSLGVGISFSIQLTEYSRARRSAIQELALLRNQLEVLERTLEKQQPLKADQPISKP